MDKMPSLIFLMIWLYFWNVLFPVTPMHSFRIVLVSVFHVKGSPHGRMVLGCHLILRKESLESCLEPLYVLVCQLWASLRINVPDYFFKNPSQYPLHFALGLIRILGEESSNLIFKGYMPWFYCPISWLVILACREWCQSSVSRFLLNFSMLVMYLQTFRLSKIFQFRDSVL